MDRDETFTLEMFTRVRAFGLAHANQFPETSRGGELLVTINQVIEELRGHAASQVSKSLASKGGTALNEAAFAALQDDLEAISRTARVMAFSIPGLDEKFRLPRNVGKQKWLATARSMAQDAEPLKAEFIRRGLPEDFLDDLKADIAKIERGIDSRDQNKGAGVAATIAIDDAVERGMRAVREMDAIVRNIFRTEPATLGEWTSARHIERAPRHATKPATQPDKSKQ